MTTNLSDCIDFTSAEAVDSTLTIPGVTFDNEAVVVGDTAIPAIEANWSAPTNPFVVGIEFEWTLSGGGSTRQQRLSLAGGVTHWQTTDGVVPRATYSCRWRAVGLTAVGDWSTPVDVTTLPAANAADLIGILWEMEVNLWRFDHLVPEHGAVELGTWPTDPFTGFGTQGRAWSMPGTDALVALRRTETRNRIDEDGNARYSYSFEAKVSTGTATMKFAFVDAGTRTPNNNWSINGVAVSGPQSINLTTTPTVFEIENVTSTNTAWRTCDVLLYFDSILSGQTVQVSDVMSHYGEREAGVGFRPSPDEDNILFYAEEILEVQQAYVAARPNMRLQSNAAGNGHKLTPFGITGSRKITASTDVMAADVGGYIWQEGASDLNVTFQPNSSIPIEKDSVVALSKRGTGNITAVAGTGVTVRPNITGSLTIDEEGDVVQYIQVEIDDWHGI